MQETLSTHDKLMFFTIGMALVDIGVQVLVAVLS